MACSVLSARLHLARGVGGVRGGATACRMGRLGPRACWVCAALLVLGAQLLKGPHRQPPREKPSAHGPPQPVTATAHRPPQPVTLGTPGSPAEPPEKMRLFLRCGRETSLPPTEEGVLAWPSFFGAGRSFKIYVARLEKACVLLGVDTSW